MSPHGQTAIPACVHPSACGCALWSAAKSCMSQGPYTMLTLSCPAGRQVSQKAAQQMASLAAQAKQVPFLKCNPVPSCMCIIVCM